MYVYMYVSLLYIHKDLTITKVYYKCQLKDIFYQCWIDQRLSITLHEQDMQMHVSGVTFILIFSREYLSCITLCWSQADIMSGYFLS